ncbi:hypothetical protein GGQ12_003086, partial [Salinibacter ruber]|nr:hypothetical protein [Salinibacter ruber]
MSFDAETASSETVIIHVGEALEAVLISISVDHPSRKPLRVRLIFGMNSQL